MAGGKDTMPVQETMPARDGMASKESVVDNNYDLGEVTIFGAAFSNKRSSRSASRLRIFFVMVALCINIGCIALDAGIISGAIPLVASHFGPADGYSWIGHAFIVAWAFMAPVWGFGAIYLGGKRTMLLSGLTLIVGSGWAGGANGIKSLIVARTLQGMGAGGVAALINEVIREVADPGMVNMLLGISGALWGVITPLGPVCGGILSHTLAWRWIFWLNVPMVLIALIMLEILVQPPPDPTVTPHAAPERIDWPGISNIIPATSVYITALDLSGVESAAAIGWLVAGLVLAGMGWWTACAVVEWKMAHGKYALLPLPTVRRRTTVACLLYCFFNNFGLEASPFWTSQYFGAALGRSSEVTATYLTVGFAGTFIGWIASDLWMAATGHSVYSMAVGNILMIAGYSLNLTYWSNVDMLKIISQQAIIMIGVGLSFQPALVALQSGIQKHDTVDVAAFNILRQVSPTVVKLLALGALHIERMRRRPELERLIGADAASLLENFGAANKVQREKLLPPEQEKLLKDAIATSFRSVWVVFLVFAIVGICILPCIEVRKVKKARKNKGREDIKMDDVVSI